MGSGVRVGVGTRFVYEGEVVRIVELVVAAVGNEVLLQDGRGRILRMSMSELLLSGRAKVLPEDAGPEADDDDVSATVALALLTPGERDWVLERAGHVRELLTGYRSGHAGLAGTGEPRREFDPGRPLTSRYEAKATELGVDARTVRRWVQSFRDNGEAGLVPAGHRTRGAFGGADERWVETAVEVMAEHAEASKPTQSIIIRRTDARVIARYGPGQVRAPSRATAYRILAELDRRVPTFAGSTKAHRDAADRPATAYGRLRPCRPGEYMLLDTTRSDVFALDPVTLRWVQADITVAMDWYTRCITGLRVTPVGPQSVDASGTLFQCYRPPPAPAGWPQGAVWPHHGVPRGVVLDAGALEGPLAGAVVGPAVVPETIVVDHGKIYVSAHLTSVCRRLGISIQPARLRTGRDKGPVERFFRTLRQGLLEALPGYKGPDVYSRGLAPEGEAFFFLDELEAIIREWIAVVYHHKPHRGLIDPRVPGLRLSPAMMFEHGVARVSAIT